MQESTHDPIGRLGANHPIVAVTYDYVLGCGAATRADAEAILDNLPPGFGELTADERAAVLARFGEPAHPMADVLEHIAGTLRAMGNVKRID